MHVVTLDDFCSFFRLTNAYKLTHSDTCSCWAFPRTALPQRPSHLSVLHASFTEDFNLLPPCPPDSRHLIEPFFFFNLTSSCYSKHSHGLYLLSLRESVYFSLISVHSIAPSQHTASKHLLNETKLEPSEYTSQDYKEIQTLCRSIPYPSASNFPPSFQDYLSLNNSCKKELTTTQDICFQEVLNIRKLFLLW